MPPSERLITRAPLSMANRIASATSLSEPSPLLSSTRIGRIFASGATPAMPMSLFDCAAMIPATCVPCPIESTSFPPSESRPRIIERPGKIFCRRSLFGPEPESITATITFAPVETLQTSLACIICSPHCASYPASTPIASTCAETCASWSVDAVIDADVVASAGELAKNNENKVVAAIRSFNKLFFFNYAPIA